MANSMPLLFSIGLAPRGASGLKFLSALLPVVFAIVWLREELVD